MDLKKWELESENTKLRKERMDLKDRCERLECIVACVKGLDIEYIRKFIPLDMDGEETINHDYLDALQQALADYDRDSK